VRNRPRRKKPRSIGYFIGRAGIILVVVVVSYYGFCALLLASYNFISPPITGVQIQRLIEAGLVGEPLAFSYEPVSRDQISQHLGHAVVAAEDGRFFVHFGVDWKAIQEAMEDNRRRGTMWRGGSTITQQLVKNLFMTTHSSLVRKAFEVPLTFMAEVLLPKERILTLYLNVIEWSGGVYGAEAASQHYFGASAEDLSRHQAASLAAVIPSPRSRSPQQMGTYTRIIQRRMTQMGY